MSPDRKRQTQKDGPTQTELDGYEAAKNAWASSIREIIEFTQDSDSEEVKALGEKFVHDGMTTNRFYSRWGDLAYRDDQPPSHSWQKPYGIEVQTFGRGMKVALNGILLHKEGLFDSMAADDLDELNDETGLDEPMTAEEIEEFKQKTITEGPQALFYFLDAFPEEAQNAPLTRANFLFATHMAAGMAEEKFPVSDGYPGTPEFNQHLFEGLQLVKRYLSALEAGDQEQLTEELHRLSSMDDTELEGYARSFLLNKVEVCKSQGIIDKWNSEKLSLRLKPADAIAQGQSFLDCDSKNLPKNVGKIESAPSPSEPWSEYTTNNWDRNHQLFGRYETSLDDGRLQVDYMLDSTHFPSQYGFFSYIEVSDIQNGNVKQRIVLSQEAVGGLLPFAVIVGGEFNFSDSRVEPYLKMLAEDPNAKKDVKNVVKDVLEMQKEGRLHDVEGLYRWVDEIEAEDESDN